MDENLVTRRKATAPIVVGVEGSSASLSALRWAAGEARLRRAELVAVRVCQPIGQLRAPYAPPCHRLSAEEEQARAHAELRDALRDVLGPAPPITVHTVVVHDRPASALLGQAAQAELLVLGGHHSTSPLMSALGPVAAACVRHSPCPVVIVALDGIRLARRRRPHGPKRLHPSRRTGRAPDRSAVDPRRGWRSGGCALGWNACAGARTAVTGVRRRPQRCAGGR